MAIQQNQTVEKTKTAKASSAAIDREIVEILDQWIDAFRAADLERILKLYSPEVVGFDMMPPLQFKGVDEYRKAWMAAYDMGGKGPWIYKPSERTIHASGDVAFMHCLAECGSVMDGKEETGWIRHTQGLRKIEGKWLIVHDSTSVPLDMKEGKALMNLKPEDKFEDLVEKAPTH